MRKQELSRETVRPVIKNLCRHADIVCWNLGDLYATGSQFIEPTSVYSVNMFLDNGFRPIWIRIWKKQGQNFGVGPYHLVSNKPVQQYEYISAFSKNGEAEEYNSDTEQKRKAIEKAIPEESTLKQFLNSNRYCLDDEETIKQLYGLR